MATLSEEFDRGRRIAAAAVSAQQAIGSRPSMAHVMRTKADVYSALGLTETARFLADKAIHSSSDVPLEDILMLARVHVAAGNYRRALHVLRSSELPDSSLPGRLLVAQCLFSLGEFNECLTALGDTETEPSRAVETSNLDSSTPAVPRKVGRATMIKTPKTASRESSSASSAFSDTPEIRAALCVMRAMVYEHLENMEKAGWWYKRALVWDVFCYEAFVRLVDNGLESSDRARKFAEDLLNFGIKSVPNIATDDAAGQLWSKTPSPDAHGGAMRSLVQNRKVPLSHQAALSAPSTNGLHVSESHNWMCSFYHAQADRSGTKVSMAAQSLGGDDPNLSLNVKGIPRKVIPISELGYHQNILNSVDVQALDAARHFQCLNFEECVRVTRAIFAKDPFVESRVMLLHLAVLVELDERHELFVTAHALVETTPRKATSWLAVGYYYFACGKYELARRYLQKATSLSPRLGPAWVVIGHAFAAQDESDHALAAYRTASRLMPEAPLPQLFMGMEYARQNSLEHASCFFLGASESCPNDPSSFHELGVIAYRNGDIESALKFFKKSLGLWAAVDRGSAIRSASARRAEAEEALHFNLGRCYWVKQDAEGARGCFERALSLNPRSASLCMAIGMTLHADDDISGAVSMYHRALRYNPDDTTCTMFLERALGDLYPK